MTPFIVILTIAAYFIILFTVSRLASANADNKGFFTGNRQAPWPLVAIATVGAAISGVTFISVPGMVVDKSYSYLQMVLGFIVGYWVIAFVLVPLFYKRNLISIYGYLHQRFGMNTYRTGAWFFFISKMLGASVRFFVVCIVIQALVCDPLHIPFVVNVAVMVGIVWLYTFRGGVKSLIWTDALKSFCLVASVIMCIYFISRNLGWSLGDFTSAVTSHTSARIFFFDDPGRGIYFWKQFIAGVFMAIAINGLDQDMMQRNLACHDSMQCRKNMIVSGVMQFFVIGLFLILGTVLVIYVENMPAVTMPEKSDELFSIVATHSSLPVMVGVLFILGLVSAAYSAAGSALVSLTTSFTVDILDASKLEEKRLSRLRKWVHAGMSLTMGAVIVLFFIISEEDAISAVYTLASYTYGPILGLFTFGIFFRHTVRDRYVPVACIAAPCLSWATQHLLRVHMNYEVSFELLVINAMFTICFLFVLSKKSWQKTSSTVTSGL